MSPVKLTRREALRLVISTLVASATMEALGQTPSSKPIPYQTTAQTISAGGVDMHITETRQNGRDVVHIVLTKDGAKLFETSTTLINTSPTEAFTSQTLTDGHGFTYYIQVNAKQSPTQPDQPPQVTFRVVLQQQAGKKQEFSGSIGSSSNPDTKYPPSLDSVLPGNLKEQLAPLNGPVQDKVQGLEKTTGIHPEKEDHPHVWAERNCHALCNGISGLGALIICGGTVGIGCAIASVGFLMTASYCSDACPK
ncbi:hypothetical protein [Tunturibacter empetritectus]|uniref:Uncharacterized protein n=1 Tax=Tunturiibacter lichenicola TaxID=2051959 RepID=A0A7W8J714_9BACT|nr:hypothetical protein [Edaphobacter lichenicola]MBB5342462.1 hypothetical protein [Edaphobacter lichenicola]